jgi:hypothetical protein
MSERRFGVEPVAFDAAFAHACHLGGSTGFVDKDQPVALPAHDWSTALLPVGSSLGNAGICRAFL